jgi:hypothetical protein
MSIPARMDYDPDLVIAVALNKAESLARAYQAQKEELARLTTESEARKAVALEKAGEAREQWIRAENAKGEVARLKAIIAGATCSTCRGDGKLPVYRTTASFEEVTTGKVKTCVSCAGTGRPGASRDYPA